MENRRRLIREVLDSDKNINIRVSNIQRQKLLGVTEDVAPYIQINQEDINKMKLYASTLRQVLEKRYLLTNNFLSDDSLPNVNKYIVELAQTEDVILAYNNVVSIYLNPRNTPETKTYIRRLLIAFEEIVRSIGINIFEIIGRIKISRKQDHINLMLYALTLYKIIGEQMNTGIFHIITNTDMKHDFNINQKLYNTAKLTAVPIHYDMADDDYKDFLDEPDDDDAVVLRTMAGEPEGETLPRRGDIPGSSSDPTPQYYSPRQTERGELLSRARFPRLGPTDLRLGEEQAQSHSDLPPLEGAESEGEREPEDEEDTLEKDEGAPQASDGTEYFTTSKKITSEVIIEALREYNKKHPDNPIAIPPQAVGEYDYVYRAKLNSIRRAHNIEIYTTTIPIAVPPSDPYDKMRYTIEKNAVYKSGANKGYIPIQKLMSAISKYESEKRAKIDYPPEAARTVKTFYNYLTQYITFVNEDGEEYEPTIEGSGRPKKETIPSTEPAMHFNDVRNDPYFITQ